jgi:hypothetical protein
MEEKTGTKRSRSPSKEGSPAPSSVPTPLPTPSGSPPSLGSSPDVFLRRPRSPMFEQGGPSEKAPVVDLYSSSNEEGLIPDTSCDEEFTRKLFGDLNRDVLGPPGDGNIIILSDSDDEEEVLEEDAANAEAAPSSVVMLLAPTASTAYVDEDPKGMQDDNSDDLAPDQEKGDGSNGGDKAGSP